MSLNTTGHLLSDMERLREHLDVGKWLLRGGSWGVKLSLAYAERYPERVSGMLMLSVTSTRRTEIDWLYRGVGRFFPEAWARFRDFPGLASRCRLPTDSEPPIEGLLAAYSQLMENPDTEVRSRAAAEWVAWEDAGISQEPNGSPGAHSARIDDARLAFVRICSHYFSHGASLEDGALIREAGELAGIPGVMIHGRNDLGGGACTPWEIARAWPEAELIIRGLWPHRKHRDDRASARRRRPPLREDHYRRLAHIPGQRRHGPAARRACRSARWQHRITTPTSSAPHRRSASPRSITRCGDGQAGADWAAPTVALLRQLAGALGPPVWRPA